MTGTTASRPRLSVIIPAHNEAANLPELHRRLSAALDPIGPWEAVYVNDGSRDATLEVLRALRAQDPRIAIVNLSRNFGKEIATTAGLDHAAGDAVVIIDADLQDPPEVIPRLVAEWEKGTDIVYAKQRERAGETRMKKATAHTFYWLMSHMGRVEMPRDVGDFRLMSRRTVDALLRLQEQHRFMKGLFAWIGYPSVAVPYDRAPRHNGRTTWNYWKLWNLALEGITSYTVMPLKIATYLGLVIALFAVLYSIVIVVKTLLYGNPVAGYPSLISIVLFLGGVQLMTLGVIGEYLGRIFNETKGRPLYFVEPYEPATHVDPPRDPAQGCEP